jgi:dTDP-4-dehydrorhamnose 3,5-epimerase
MPFSFFPTSLSGVVIIEPKAFVDSRGFFLETYKQSDFDRAGIDAVFVQENHSRSIKDTLRGLHAQRSPKTQSKLVRVIEGEVLDVAADVRRDSPTFGQWVGVTLSAENRRLLYVPAGYVHGFYVVSAEAQVIYKTTHEYAPDYEYGIRWDDPQLAIKWPGTSPLLSERDKGWPLLSESL